MQLHVTKPSCAGRWIKPADLGRIYGFEIKDQNNHTVASMTANEVDIDERLALAEEIVSAFNSARSKVASE